MEQGAGAGLSRGGAEGGGRVAAAGGGCRDPHPSGGLEEARARGRSAVCAGLRARGVFPRGAPRGGATAGRAPNRPQTGAGPGRRVLVRQHRFDGLPNGRAGGSPTLPRRDARPAARGARPHPRRRRADAPRPPRRMAPHGDGRPRDGPDGLRGDAGRPRVPSQQDSLPPPRPRGPAGTPPRPLRRRPAQGIRAARRHRRAAAHSRTGADRRRAGVRRAFHLV